MFEYVGAIHVHSSFSDGSGNVKDIGNIASEAGLDFIIITDHNTLRALKEGYEGWYGNTLLLVGCEINDKENKNHYLALGINDTISTRLPAKEIVAKVNDAGGIGFIAHPLEKRSSMKEHPAYPWTEWDIKDFDGIEIWNHMSEWMERLTEENKYQAFVHPLRTIESPTAEMLELWDKLNLERKVVGIGGVDAHAHKVNLLGFFEVEVFPYKVLFKSIRTHILADEKIEVGASGEAIDNAKQIIKNSLKSGRCFVSNHYHSDAAGFRFFAQDENEIFQMGDTVKLTENLNFFPAVYYRLAKIYEEEKHWEEALSCYSKIEYLYPFHEFSPEAVKKTVYLELYRTESPYTPFPGEALCAAETYYVRHRFKLALKYYREYTELYPKEALSSGGYYDRASCELAAGSGEKAVKLLRETYEDGGEYAPAAFYKLAELSGSTKKMKEVAEKYPGTDKGSEAQYKAGLYLEYDGKKSEAMKEYRLMADLFPEGNWGDAAFWRLGRIYYREKLYSNAYDAFLRVSALYSRNDWASDCIFWQAKCAEKMGRQGEAESLYKKLADNYDHTYYSYRAREKLVSMGYEEYTLSGPEEKPSFREGLRTAFKGTFEDRHYENFTELAQLGLFEYAENELLLVKFPEEKEREKKYALALVKAGEKKYVDAIKLINEIYEEMIFTGKTEEIPLAVTYANYPLGYGENIMREAEIREIDPCLVSALIREESHYDPSVISWADAYGLMQIIPSTGEYIAKKLSRNFSVNDLIIPEKNIEMGTFYIAKIYRELDNNEVLALAGYNGGPGNAEYWWDTKYKGDIDEFIEDIPYGETRDYVKKVLRTYWEYKRLYDREQPDYCGRW